MTAAVAAALERKVAAWQAELDRLPGRIVFRWGDARRFHSQARKIARVKWLIDRLSTARAKLQNEESHHHAK